VPLALGFVADFIGLRGLTAAVKGQLKRVRALVHRLVERLLAKVMKMASRLVATGEGGVDRGPGRGRALLSSAGNLASRSPNLLP
jgi:hypothetical protein